MPPKCTNPDLLPAVTSGIDDDQVIDVEIKDQLVAHQRISDFKTEDKYISGENLDSEAVMGNLDSSHGNSAMNAFFERDKDRTAGTNDKMALISNQRYLNI